MGFSVLLSVYNKEKAEYFTRAMRSIWDDQTLKPDEIVLVKDGPLNAALNAAIEKFQIQSGDVLKVVSLEKNMGLGAALNEGLKHCSYELVARMDTDDISLPDRFEKQVKFMKDNPEIAVSSAWIEEFDEKDNTVAIRKVPVGHEEIRKYAKSRNPISHPVTIFRKKPILAVGGYPVRRKSQDYALWSLLLVNDYKFANIPDILLRMRTNSEFLNRRGYSYLRSEISLMRTQVKIGLYNWPVFLRNLMIRSVVRLSPAFIKGLFYRYARR